MTQLAKLRKSDVRKINKITNGVNFLHVYVLLSLYSHVMFRPPLGSIPFVMILLLSSTPLTCLSVTPSYPPPVPPYTRYSVTSNPNSRLSNLFLLHAWGFSKIELTLSVQNSSIPKSGRWSITHASHFMMARVQHT